MQSNNFQNVYTPQFNEQYSVKQEKDIRYEEVYYYLAVSSKDRNTTDYPDVNKYTINLPKEYKNISSIELIQAIIPDQNQVTKEPYLLLKIDELEDVMASTDRNISDAFAILQLAPPTTSPHGFIQIDKRIHENTVKYYRIPKASLTRMTISITDYLGALFDFGNDSTPIDKKLQNTFVFKITCLEKTRSELNHRNVF
jgi:hypothetical protein